MSQFQFLLRIVAQLKEDGKSINWQRLNMPGRTTKSLQNMWTKINKAVADLEENGGSGTSSATKTPTKRAATRKSPTLCSKCLLMSKWLQPARQP